MKNKKPKTYKLYTCSLAWSMDRPMLPEKGLKAYPSEEIARKYIDCLDECDIIELTVSKVRKVKV